MEVAALVVSLLAATAIVVLEIRLFTSPSQATRDYGVAADNVSASAAVKGGRDITTFSPADQSGDPAGRSTA